MNEKIFEKDKRNQRIAINWLKVFSIVCIINLLPIFFLGGEYSTISLLLPFLHILVFNIVVRIATQDISKEKDSYIKEKYPEIWKKLKPFGQFSYSVLSDLEFMDGKYDAGDDEILNKIRNSYKEWYLIYYLWPAGIFIITAIISLFLVHT